jgi:hypothetical protein
MHSPASSARGAACFPRRSAARRRPSLVVPMQAPGALAGNRLPPHQQHRARPPPPRTQRSMQAPLEVGIREYARRASTPRAECRCGSRLTPPVPRKPQAQAAQSSASRPVASECASICPRQLRAPAPARCDRARPARPPRRARDSASIPRTGVPGMRRRPHRRWGRPGVCCRWARSRFDTRLGDAGRVAAQ